MPSRHAFWDFFVAGFILKLQLDKIPKRLCLQLQATSWPLEFSSYCSAYCSQFFSLAVHHANGLVGQRFSRLLFRLPCFWTTWEIVRNLQRFVWTSVSPLYFFLPRMPVPIFVRPAPRTFRQWLIGAEPYRQLVVRACSRADFMLSSFLPLGRYAF